jgi:hypothetical protein
MADFCTLAELRTYTGTTAATLDDVTGNVAIDAATNAIVNSCNRTFELVGSATTRYFTASFKYSDLSPAAAYWYPWPGVFPFAYLTSVLPAPGVDVDDFFISAGTNPTLVGITVTDFVSGVTYTPARAWPFNAAAKGLPYTRILFAPGTAIPNAEGQLGILAKWGWSAVPLTIKNAELLQASRFAKRKDSPLGGVTGSDAMGNVMRAARVDPDIENMLSSFRRWYAAA